MSGNELFERVVELSAECRDDGMSGGEFVSTVAYGLGRVSQFTAPNKDAVMDLIETAVKEARKDAVMGLIEAAVTEAYEEEGAG
jgi:hypothetical protein